VIHTRQFTSALQLRDDGDGRVIHGAFLPWGTEARVLDQGRLVTETFQRGAFAGRTQRDAYFVKCDADTTTPDDVDSGTVNIVVGFAPLKPAEFVVLRIQQLARAPARDA